MTRAESALATAKRLAEAAAEEQRLGRIIGAAGTCYAGGEVYEHEVGGYLRVSHLTAYLREDKSARYDRHGDPDHGEAEDAYSRMTECPTCSAAYQAIQDRRALRRRRGALRAALVRIGKLALEEDNP